MRFNIPESWTNPRVNSEVLGLTKEYQNVRLVIKGKKRYIIATGKKGRKK